MTRHFSVLGKPCKRLLTHLRVYLQNITILLSASSSRQQLTAVVTYFPYSIYPLSFFTLGNLRCHHEIYCKSVPTYDHHMLLLLLFVLFPLQSCFYASPSPNTHSKAKRHLYTDGNADTYSIQFISIVGVAIGFASSIHMIPEM